MAGRRIPLIAAAALGTALAVGAATGTAGAAVPGAAARPLRIGLSGAQAVGPSQVSVVASVSPVPDIPVQQGDVQVSANGAPVDAEVRPVLSDATALSLVVDASAQATEATASGGLSGVASFLLEAPPDATLSVVADQEPPVVVARPAVGVSTSLDAISRLHSGGTPATAAAIALALRQRRPGQPALVVLYTATADAGGVSAADLSARLRAAHAVLGVVTTSAEDAFWNAVTESTGGAVISTTPARALHAFDRLSDDLTARSVLTLPRPATPDPSVRVRITTSDGTGTAKLRLLAGLSGTAPAPAPARAPAGSARGSGGGMPWWIWLVLVVVVASLGLVVLRRRRSGRGGPGRPVPWAPDPESAAAMSPSERSFVDAVDAFHAGPSRLPGVRVFDVRSEGAPTEIKGSLFEPRAARDAREQIPGQGERNAG